MNMLRNILKLMGAGLVAVALFNCDVNNSGGGGPALPTTVGPADTTLPGSLSKLIASTNFGTTYTDSIAAGGVVWYRIKVQKDSVYNVACIGEPITGTGTFTDTKITILASSSVGQIAFNDDVGTDSDPSVTFKAPDSGYVRVKIEGGKATSAGSFELRVTQQDGFEPDDDFKLATLIPSDSTVQAHLTSGYDEDFFKLNVEAGKLYKVSVLSNVTMYGYAYAGDTSASATNIQSWTISASTTTPTSFVLEPTSAGVYYFSTTAYSTSTTKGIYKIAVKASVGDTFESDNGLTKASTLTVGASAQNRYLAKSDVDWFKFAADSGKFYTISFPSNPFGSVSTSFLNADSAVVPVTQTSISSVGGGTFACTKSGTYYVRVSSSSIGLYSVSLSATTTIPSWYSSASDAYESDNTLSTASTLKADSTVARHTLAYGDEDWTKIAIDSGKSYQFTLNNTGSYSCYFTVFSADSAVIISSTYASYGSLTSVLYTARRSTNVYVQVESGTSGTNYQLIVQPAATDSFESDNTQASAKPLSTDSVYFKHTLPGGDNDWLVMRTIPGSTYEVYSTSSSPYMNFYDAQGGSMSKYSLSTNSGMAYAVVAKDTLTWVKMYPYSSTTSTVSYSIAATKTPVDTFETDNSFSKAESLATDSTVQTHLTDVGDVDAIKLNVQAGKLYKVSIQASNSMYGYGYGADTTSSYLQYWSISYVTSTTSTPTTFTIEPTTTGLYYLKLSSSASSAIRGWYKIAVTETVGDAFEPDNGLTNASTLTAGGTAQSRYLGKSDVDWFKFTADSGKFYTVSFPTNALSSVTTSFLTADSVVVPVAQTNLSSYTGGAFACTKSGTYYVKVSSSYSGAYTVTLTATTTTPSWYLASDAYEPDNKLSTASVLKADSTVAKHTMAYNDVDWTKIAVDSGKTYLFSVKNSGSYSCYFSLYSADSAVITSSTTVSYGSTLSSVYTARRSTDVYVQMTSSSSGTNYQLSVQPAPTDSFELDNTLGTAKTLPTDGVAQQRVLFGSEDWIKVHLDSAVSYQIRTENFGTYATMYTEIYSADSAILGSSVSTSTGGAYIRTYKAAKATDIFVRAYVSSSYLSSYATPYTILVRPEPKDTFEADNGLSLAKPIEVNATAQYHLMSSADQDWVSFPIDSGYTYTVTAKSLTSDYMYLYLYTADSAVVGSYSYGATPSLTTVGRRKTTYFAKVTSYYTSVTTPFGYEINVKSVAPVAARSLVVE